MSIKVNQKIWRFKKDFSLYFTNLIQYKTLLFFLRKFLAIYLNLFSIILVDFTCFFKNNKLELTLFIFPSRYKKKKKLFLTKKKKSKFKIRTINNRKKKYKFLRKTRILSKRILLRKQIYLKLLILKLKLTRYLTQRLHLPVTISFIRLDTFYTKSRLLPKLTRVLFFLFKRNLLQKRYRFFCLKWFPLLPFCFFLQHTKLFCLCLKDGLERTGRKHNQFFKLFKQMLHVIAGFGIGFHGFRVEINGKINGSDRTRRFLLKYGKFPSRVTIAAKIHYDQTVAYTYTGAFGIKVLFFFNNKFNLKQVIFPTTLILKPKTPQKLASKQQMLSLFSSAKSLKTILPRKQKLGKHLPLSVTRTRVSKKAAKSLSVPNLFKKSLKRYLLRLSNRAIRNRVGLKRQLLYPLKIKKPVLKNKLKYLKKYRLEIRKTSKRFRNKRNKYRTSKSNRSSKKNRSRRNAKRRSHENVKIKKNVFSKKIKI